ncbi:hypothetical protein AERO8C_160122 [Aeromonas veronii]|uniref:Uncharacterized protein n=1 Tax=Aeromonas veronii TaxID=654 RepID=A0A653KXC4_AERVE|nr:hypothetical protein AERO8C_160122 [Aeromonas veronii]
MGLEPFINHLRGHLNEQSPCSKPPLTCPRQHFATLAFCSPPALQIATRIAPSHTGKARHAPETGHF